MKPLSSQKGSLILFIIFFGAVLLLLAVLIPDLNRVEIGIAANQRDEAGAYYLASAGIEAALGVLSENPFFSGEGEFFLGGGDISFSVNALEDTEDGTRFIKITSTGKTGFAQETISLEFQSHPAAPGETETVYSNMIYKRGS